MEIARRRINEREELIGAKTMDNALFHKLLRQQRGKQNRCIDEINVAKIRIFFSATLGIRIFKKKKNITPPLQVKRSFPK
jgi:hypothetical protein